MSESSLSVKPNYIHSTSNDFTEMGLGLRLGDVRESWETGDSREEEDTQWRQVITLYTRILRTFVDSAYFVRSYIRHHNVSTP